MKDIKKILFPVDLSDISARLAPAALMIAGKFGAELHILFVNPPVETYSTGPFPSSEVMAELEKEAIESAKVKLEEFQREHCRDMPISKKIILYGEPAAQILKYIATEDIDMVMIGTHGRTGLEHLLFGSVAEQVVRDSPVPVITINPYKESKRISPK